MPRILWCDFETRSHCDLKTKGVYNYAAHPTTEVLCLSYAFDDDEVQTWTPVTPLPASILEWTGQIRAHNAAFERLIFWRVLGVPYALEQFYCTAAQARANCAPGSLEDAGRFAGADMQKDHRGAQLIRKLCVPPYVEDETLKAELIAYCEQDVRAMRALSQSLRDLTPEELADYHANERINDRGVMVDTRLCRAAVRYAEAETEDIQARVVELTEGAVTSVRSGKLREWVLARLGAEARALCVKGDKASLDKSVRANLLAFDNPEQVPPEVREVVECADDLWASSVAKFQRLADLADRTDHRVRGAFVFAGGAATGRAASYGAQVHNFPRKAAKSPEAVRADMVAGQPIVPVHGRRVTDVLRSMLRPALVPAPGHRFVVADWAAIEGRVNPWLAGTDLGERKLDIYRRGDDIYKVNAAATFGVRYDEVSDEQRQVGKVQELALGFAGGVGAFAAMGRGYGVQVPEHAAKQMVRAWRLANPWAVRWWHDLEAAYTSALRHPGREFTAGRVVYIFEPPHLWYMLPSGRILCYPFARFEQDGISYAKASWKPAADAREWPRARLWTGTACENVTQAAAHDLLRGALRRLPETVLHVHDELVLEVPEADVGAAAERLVRGMCEPPVWAEGLPLLAVVKVLTRYGK